MKINWKQIFFLFLWLILVISGPVTVFSNSPLPSYKQETALFFSFLLSVSGTALFSLLFVQIFVGAFMDRLEAHTGRWIFKFHLINGSLIYGLAILHPLLFVLYTFKIYGVFDPYYAFVDICALCKTAYDYWLTLGRLAFWFLLLAGTAAILRSRPWWKNIWRKFHYLNYVVFILISVHSMFLGSETKIAPFSYVYLFGIGVVLLTMVVKLLPFGNKS